MMQKKTTTMLQTGQIEFTVLDFLILNSLWIRFVSDFVLRISDFDNLKVWNDLNKWNVWNDWNGFFPT